MGGTPILALPWRFGSPRAQWIHDEDPRTAMSRMLCSPKVIA